MNMRDLWNQRYQKTAYHYGTSPNDFLVQNASMISSPVLSICEGEGRNGVFLAKRGLEVTAVDFSEVALEKAAALAASQEVSLNTIVQDLSTYLPSPSHYNAVISIFAHLPSVLRARLYPALVKSLCPGGILLLEAYSTDQLSFGTGGPQEIDRLMSCEIIKSEFPTLEVVHLETVERDVIEGVGHTGRASVVQFIGRKCS